LAEVESFVGVYGRGRVFFLWHEVCVWGGLHRLCCFGVVLGSEYDFESTGRKFFCVRFFGDGLDFQSDGDGEALFWFEVHVDPIFSIFFGLCIEVHLGNEFGSTGSDDTVVDMGSASGVFSWLDGSEGESAFVFREHFCPVLEVRICGSVVFVLGVVVASCRASLPDFDDDLVEWFVIGIDDETLDHDLFSVGDGGVGSEAGEIGIEIFLFIDLGDGVEGAFCLGGGWRQICESLFDCVEGHAAGEGGLL